MAMIRGERPPTYTLPPEDRPPDFGAELRSDVWKLFVIVGVVLSIVASFFALTRGGGGGTVTTVAPTSSGAKIDANAEPASGSRAAIRVSRPHRPRPSTS